MNDFGNLHIIKKYQVFSNGHAISPYLINIFPFIKHSILEKVGKNIAQDFMNNKIS